MENASKALIIAGAILLGILIVGLGMFIYQQAVGAMEGINFDTQQIQSYNAKFQNYEGRQSGSSVIQLCNEVSSHNSSNEADYSLQIGVEYGKVGNGKAKEDMDENITYEDVSNVKKAIKSGKTYNVSFDIAPSGRIMNITIEDYTEKK